MKTFARLVCFLMLVSVANAQTVCTLYPIGGQNCHNVGERVYVEQYVPQQYVQQYVVPVQVYSYQSYQRYYPTYWGVTAAVQMNYGYRGGYRHHPNTNWNGHGNWQGHNQYSRHR